jgi:hypothetical protein
MRVGAGRDESGQSTIELLGLLVIVAMVILAIDLPALADQSGHALSRVVCETFGEADDPCDDLTMPRPPPPPAGPAREDTAAPSPITDTSFAAQPIMFARTPGSALPFDDEPDYDDQGPFTDSEYVRRDEEFQGAQFRVRGYLNGECLATQLPCTSQSGRDFRAEYTAQAHAIRALSERGGRLSWNERNWENDPIDNNVHWEASLSGDTARIDIWVHDDDSDSIIEVKRYDGTTETFEGVDDQLDRYQELMSAAGVDTTLNYELNEDFWAITYIQPPSLGDRTLRGENGTRWYAWAPPDLEGQVYFAPEDEVPEYVRAHERAGGVEDVGPGIWDQVSQGEFPDEWVPDRDWWRIPQVPITVPDPEDNPILDPFLPG